jgi:hypothetical protein
VSHVTVTDPRHSLFGQRLVVLGERSGRGPGYVAVELPGGRRRSVRKTATDLVAPSEPVGSNLPRISIRTLIPLARHVNRILNLLTEEVIRDEPAPSSASSRCGSTAEPGHREQPPSGWRSGEPLVIGAADRAKLQVLGENLPRIWHAATTSAADRKRILRFIVREVALDQKRAPGQVCLKIVWQTGATSEHRLQRRVHTYRDYIDLERLRQRIAELNGARKMDGEIAAILKGPSGNS